METSKEEGKRVIKVLLFDHDDEQEDDADQVDNKEKRALAASGIQASGAGGSTPRSCKVEDCTADMNEAKPYHRRHKVCEFHAKAPVVLVAMQQQRFCQQCSRCETIGFMSYQSLTKLKEVAEFAWPGTIKDVVRSLMILIEKRQ